MKYTHGGELVARALAAQEVGTIYTLCGGHIAPVYEGCLNNGIDIIDFRHEQAAAHAADAHARLTRQVGVALVTAGPGVTGAVTSVANAYQARSPLILLGGAAPLATKGMGALQEMQQTDMFRSFTKASITIEDTVDIPYRLHEAFELALGGRPGPVFVELPFDVLFNTVDPVETLAKVTTEPIPPKLADVRQMFQLLRTAKKPLIIAGTQVYWDEAHDALRVLTEQTSIPVFTNGAGRGSLPMTHPHCFKSSRSAALRQADLVLLIGTQLDFRLKYGRDGWNPEGKLIQIENDVNSLNHNRQAEVAVVADARLVLEALAEGLQGVESSPWLREVQALEESRREKLATWMALDDVPVNQFRFASAVNEFIDGDTIVIGDGGDIVSACAKVVDVMGPGRWLDPGPLGCLGVGAPFAIAAQHLHQDKKVLIINGDGAFGLNGFEFDTAIRFDLPIVSIVGNDAGWGQIRGPQIEMFGAERAVATSLEPVRYDELVAAMGGYGELVENPEEIGPSLKRAFASGKPACINVLLDPEGMAKTGSSMPYVV
jgi:acetolactate synthase-1/2/3 large subunit